MTGVEVKDDGLSLKLAMCEIHNISTDCDDEEYALPDHAVKGVQVHASS